MKNGTILDLISDLLVTAFEVEPEGVRVENSIDDLGLDSLAQVELGELLGEKLDVDVTEGEMVEVSTLSELIEMLERKVAEKGAAV